MQRSRDVWLHQDHNFHRHQGISGCCLWLPASLDWWVHVLWSLWVTSHWVTRVIMSHQGILDCRMWLLTWTDEYMYGHHGSPWVTRWFLTAICLPQRVSIDTQPGDFRLLPMSAFLGWWVHVQSPSVTRVVMSHQGVSDYCLWLLACLNWWVHLWSPRVTSVTISRQGHHESPGDFRLPPVTALLYCWVHV